MQPAGTACIRGGAARARPAIARRTCSSWRAGAPPAGSHFHCWRHASAPPAVAQTAPGAGPV